MTIRELFASASPEADETIQTVRQAVTFFGAVSLTIAASVGLYALVRVGKRPTANRRGFVALGIALVSWALMAWVGAASSGGPSPRLSIAASVLVLLASLVSIGLGIATFVGMSREPGRYREGRGQATTAIVLSSFLLVPLFVGVAIGVLRRPENASTLSGTEATAANGLVTIPTSGYAMRMPEAPWERVDPKLVNPSASFACVRTGPVELFMVIAEEISEDAASHATSAKLAEVSLANVRKSGTDVQLLTNEPRVIHGLAGHYLHLRATVQSKPFEYAIWTLVSGRHLYQLFAWANANEVATLERDAAELFERFQLLDASPL